MRCSLLFVFLAASCSSPASPGPSAPPSQQPAPRTEPKVDKNPVEQQPAATTKKTPKLSVTTGAITGQVTDLDGNAVVAATVVATSRSHSGTNTVLTDDDGDFMLEALAPGRYKIAIYYGEATYTRVIEVAANSATDVPPFAIDPNLQGEIVDMTPSVPVTP